MNVTKCEECGYEISIKTDRCLNCGEKISKLKPGKIKSYTRRVLFILFAIYILLSALKIFK